MGEERRLFPMQGGPWIAWDTAELIYCAYSRLFGTQQTLERLAERGGFSWSEVELIFTKLREKDRPLWSALQTDLAYPPPPKEPQP